MNGELVLGVDAGSTKTLALIADPSGTVLGQGRAGGSNIYLSEGGALEAIAEAVRLAQRSAGLADPVFGAVTLSACGADWPEDFALFSDQLRRWSWADNLQVVNDAVGALRAGSLSGLGVAVVCGTGAGTAARSPQGQLWHSSFWQEPEGAEQLGRLALRAVYRAELGLEPPTSLTAALLAHCDVPDVEALLHAFTARHVRAPALGRLARVLLDEAARGDPTSLILVQRHGAALGDYALVAARKVGLGGAYLLVTSGGVMRHPSPLLRQALIERVQAAHPDVTWQASRHEPVFGALLLSLERTGLPVNEAVFRRLEDTCPDTALFLT